ncbi:MAG: nitronate monooxygenase [Proteobacteria bacterium]|nr:nitronate monooxygenase [Pseudomonadota bacterium]MBU1744977.1 nitronate monooxygenase [Pseudomonadota bacterium]MBU1966468.1 nitronate monooxygenase [Pseudomonadota bacterium]MBU4372796.1 nitronate monooxygenase [Pseudomonadota bacterium]MBU4583476.1 nitronate monooxygenase [Pseudomonadota bacterium]
MLCAVFALGAEGVQVGTRFLASDESPTGEESEHPPLTSCSQMAFHPRTEKADKPFATKPDKSICS